MISKDHSFLHVDQKYVFADAVFVFSSAKFARPESLKNHKRREYARLAHPRHPRRPHQAVLLEGGQG